MNKEYMKEYNKKKKEEFNNLKQIVRKQELTIKELQTENKILKQLLNNNKLL